MWIRVSRSACAGALIALSLPTAGRAQRATQVDLDNDSFNFWQAPRVRADREYTQGTRVNFLRPTTSHIAQRLLGGPNSCAGGAESRDCRMISVAITQSIYTPTLFAPKRRPGERPFAGWLGAEIGLLRERARGLAAFSLGVGVTGAASLAAPAQKAIHRLFGFQRPDGWDTQLPSEVGVLATYRGAVSLIRIDESRSRLRFALAPLWTVRAGTVATDATLGAQITFGVHAPAPWQGATNVYGDRWGLFVRGGAQQTGVAHNLFLDGSTFASSASVEKRRWVAETQFGIGARSPIGMLEWQVHSRGREYRLQPTAHAYSSLSFSLR
jgi:lipid A 3-O-deacylase